jgi:hypothetical protein
MDFHRDFWWIRKRIERHAVRSYQYFNPDYVSILIMLEPLGYGSRRPSPLPSSTSNAVASHPLVVFGMDHGSLSGSLPTDSLLGLLQRGGLEEKNLRYVVHPTISSVAR